MIKADFHAHTWYSGDSLTSPAKFVASARRAGLDRAAVTDHGTIEGALETHSLAPELIIVGEEIRCACDTELIGLYLTEQIPNGLSLTATADRIRSQGGIIYAPHPFAYLSDIERRAQRLLAIADIIEIFNSRAFYPPWNRRALEYVARHGLRGAASSDAHMPWELGRAYNNLPTFSNAEELRAAMAHAAPVAVHRGSAFVHVGSVGLHAVRRLFRRGHGVPFKRPAGQAPYHGG